MVGASGCQQYPFTFKPDERVVVTRFQATIGSSGNTDILFVIDNSGSMKDKQDDLRANASAFINEISNSDNQYHIGIVTTDLLSPGDGGRLRIVRPGNDAANGAANGARFLSRPDPQAANIAALRQEVIDTFNATIKSLGTNGSSNEMGLGAFRYALDAAAHPDVGAYNAGFLRSDADLAIIILTDEDDCSFKPEHAGDVAAWTDDATCYQRLNDLAAPESYVDFLATLKRDVSHVRAAVITGGVRNADGTFSARGCRIGLTGPSTACGCWSYSTDPYFCSILSESFGQPCQTTGSCDLATCPSSSTAANCDTPRCSATAATRYTRFIDELGQRRVKAGVTQGTYADSVCQADYHEAMLSIAKSVVLSDCFTLGTAATSASDIQMKLSRPGEPTRVVKRVDANDATAACKTCGDCPTGAWRYVNAQTICLDCGLSKNTGDNYDISAVSQVVGTPSP